MFLFKAFILIFFKRPGLKNILSNFHFLIYFSLCSRRFRTIFRKLFAIWWTDNIKFNNIIIIWYEFLMFCINLYLFISIYIFHQILLFVFLIATITKNTYAYNYQSRYRNNNYTFKFIIILMINIFPFAFRIH